MVSTQWRLQIDHLTAYRYESSVRASYNEVRQSPATTSRQTALETRLQTSPAASQYSYQDYWGTRVVAFNIDAPHDRLSVHSTSLVETRPWVGRTDATWGDVAGVASRYAELLAPSPYTEPDRELTELGLSFRQASPLATTEKVITWVNDTLDYVRGVTHVQTSASEAYIARSGVCQDFAHLALTVLRASGLPVRYASGYLHPDADAAIGNETLGESHAWIEAWLGEWWGIDPSSATVVEPRYVVIARGRDYADVPPLRGIYAGEPQHDAEVSVKITRIS
jgi:transglutaminase-like putative cysteine protease